MQPVPLDVPWGIAASIATIAGLIRSYTVIFVISSLSKANTEQNNWKNKTKYTKILRIYIPHFDDIFSNFIVNVYQ